jgi:alkylated DNA repair dioxygenase AlkB
MSNLLPLPDTKIYYFPNFIDYPDDIFRKLVGKLNIDYKKNGRSSSMYGDNGSEWIPELLEIKNQIEEFLDHEQLFNCHFDKCLCNYYKNGNIIFRAHSDREERNKETPIASVSLGTPRLFYFRSMKNKEFKYQFKLV